MSSRILEVIYKDYTLHEQKICTQNEGHRELHPGPMSNSSVCENFVKINFFNLISNFDQATQKNLKSYPIWQN